MYHPLLFSPRRPLTVRDIRPSSPSFEPIAINPYKHLQLDKVGIADINVEHAFGDDQLFRWFVAVCIDGDRQYSILRVDGHKLHELMKAQAAQEICVAKVAAESLLFLHITKYNKP